MQRLASIALFLCLLPTAAADVIDISFGHDDPDYEHEWFEEEFATFIFITLGVLLMVAAIVAIVAAAS